MGGVAALGVRQGRGRRQHVGPAATMPGFKPTESINSNTLKFISNNFKLDLIQKDLPKLKNFEVKYGGEGFGERNSFLHRKVFRFKMNFELQIWEVNVCF
jgi:hypothetical protein